MRQRLPADVEAVGVGESELVLDLAPYGRRDSAIRLYDRLAPPHLLVRRFVSVLGVDEELVEGRLVGGDSVCEGLAEARLEAQAGLLRVHGQEGPDGRRVIDHHARQLPLRRTIGDL